MLLIDYGVPKGYLLHADVMFSKANHFVALSGPFLILIYWKK